MRRTCFLVSVAFVLARYFCHTRTSSRRFSLACTICILIWTICEEESQKNARERQRKKERKKEKKRRRQSEEKNRKTRYWKSLSQTTSQLVMYTLWVHICLLIVRYCQDGLSYVWNYNIINMCPRAYSVKRFCEDAYTRRYIRHIGNRYISIYICNVYIYIFTGESHMKASQGHDMRRAN